MNERIKELATKARLLTGWPVGEMEYQKFAELIIRECAMVAFKKAGPKTALDVLEYFGVEE